MAAALIATNKFGSRSNSILNCVPIFFNAPFQFQMGDYLVVVFIVADVFGKIFFLLFTSLKQFLLRDYGRCKFFMIFFLLFEDFEHI